MFFQEVYYSFVGVATFFLLWVIMYLTSYKSASVKNAIAKTKNIREYSLFVGSLLFITIGLFVTIKAGNITMTPELDMMVRNLYGLIWVLFGILIGSALLFIGKFIWVLVKGMGEGGREKYNNEVRLIAYHLWEKEEHPNGRELEHWIKAKAIWKEQHKKK